MLMLQFVTLQFVTIISEQGRLPVWRERGPIPCPDCLWLVSLLRLT